MKRATRIPFLLLVVLAVAALVVKGPAPAIPTGGPINSGDVAWMLTAAALVLLMTPGLSFFYGGMVSLKNVVSTMLQSVVALGIISLVWVAVGFSLAFGDSLGGFVGNPLTFAMFDGVGEATHPTLSPTVPLVVFALFQLKFAIITPALITGSFAERVRFSSYLLFIVLFSLFIYAPLAHWTWHPDGFLRKWGVLDFAGGTVVHMSAGWAALAGALILGRRQSHVSNETPSPANVPFVLLGTGMLWFGWFGFNAGSALGANGAAAMAFATTNTASAAAMLGWMFFDWMRGRKPSALGACIGAVVGLVAITPAAGFVTIRQSLFIGVFASVVSNLAAHWKSKSTLDDTLDVFPCHGVGGMVGMLLTGILAKDVGLITGQWATFLAHLAALVIVSAFTFCGSWVLYKVTDLIIPLRVSEEQEIEGLDLSQHGETAIAAELILAPSTNGQGVHVPKAGELVLS
ncbi:MAG TPA: ammonium transporter [Isosphaeraceae bacterium]|nr:ammonium transporter [Isosphaeraceae bacterium]